MKKTRSRTSTGGVLNFTQHKFNTSQFIRLSTYNKKPTARVGNSNTPSSHSIEHNTKAL